jgi:hypothetical protein
MFTENVLRSADAGDDDVDIYMRCFTVIFVRSFFTDCRYTTDGPLAYS